MRVGIVFVLIFCGSACLKSTGVVEKVSKPALSQKCLLPNSLTIQNVSRKLAAASVIVDASFCSNIENYTCSRKRFSPTAKNGKSTVEECVKLDEFGGSVCLMVNSQSYNTSDAAKRVDISPSESLPGGELNRSDYLCDQSKLLDGDDFLAIGEGDDLAGALLGAYSKCMSIAPRLSSEK